MYETPHEKASMITKKVIRNIPTSFIMAFMLRMIGPKYLEAIPILIILMMARVKATPHKILPEDLRSEMSKIDASAIRYSNVLISNPIKKSRSMTML